jgi:hypothetical protein
VFLRAGVRGDATGRDGALAQCPKELLVPVFANFFAFNVGERPRDAAVGIVHGAIDGCAVLCAQAVLLVPDI